MHNSNPYAVKLIRGGGYQRFDTARLCISVGQEYHEGAKFQAALDWASARFKHVIISVADTLQRHNMDAIDAHDQARQLGDLWLMRNVHTINISSNIQVQRWDMWLSHPEYADTLNCIKGLYADNAHFCSDVDTVATAFVSKHGSNFKNCVNYLLEETAIFAIQQAVEPAADVYPGTLTLWDCFIKEHIVGAPPSLAKRHTTRIGFTKRAA